MVEPLVFSSECCLSGGRPEQTMKRSVSCFNLRAHKSDDDGETEEVSGAGRSLRWPRPTGRALVDELWRPCSGGRALAAVIREAVLWYGDDRTVGGDAEVRS